MVNSPETGKSLEQQFQSETGEEMSVLDNLKVSEVVGETVGENFSDGSKSKSTKKREDKDSDIKKLISTSRAKKVILPTMERQRARVETALRREQKQLLSKAVKMQNSRKFSASAVEELYRDIRRIQTILDELLRSAGKRITELYKRYVLRSS